MVTLFVLSSSLDAIEYGFRVLSSCWDPDIRFAMYISPASVISFNFLNIQWVSPKWNKFDITEMAICSCLSNNRLCKTHDTINYFCIKCYKLPEQIKTINQRHLKIKEIFFG